MGGFHHAPSLVDSVITCHIRSPVILRESVRANGEKEARARERGRREREGGKKREKIWNGTKAPTKIVVYARIRAG